MPRPVKIKKAKSFMFTTKHHSFVGVMGCVIGVISLIVFFGSMHTAFLHAGKLNIKIASQGFFAFILDIIGIIAGMTALSEKDIHRWVPIASILGNILLLALWLVLIITA